MKGAKTGSTPFVALKCFSKPRRNRSALNIIYCTTDTQNLGINKSVMKLKYWLLCILVLNLMTRAYALNSTGKISGVIADAQYNPLPGSTIVLYNAGDPT